MSLILQVTVLECYDRNDIFHVRNPSIEGDTPFKSCETPNEIYCQEISNDPTSSVATNIREQFHYNSWREIEETCKEVRKRA